MQLELRFLSLVCLFFCPSLPCAMFPLPLHEWYVFFSLVVLSLRNIWYSQWSVCEDRRDKGGKSALSKIVGGKFYQLLYALGFIFICLAAIFNCCLINASFLVCTWFWIWYLSVWNSSVWIQGLNAVSWDQWSYIEYLFKIISVL